MTEGHKTCLTTESVYTLGTQMDYWIVKRVSFWVCECSRLVTIWSWACLASGRSDEWAALCVFIIRPSLESFLPPINLMAPTQDGLASSRQSGTCRQWSALPLAHRVDNFKEVSAGTCFVGLCVFKVTCVVQPCVITPLVLNYFSPEYGSCTEFITWSMCILVSFLTRLTFPIA